MMPTAKMVSEIAALEPFLSQDERAELDALLSAQEDWEPQDGPQRMAYESAADILLYGGAAGGGKSDLLLGVAHQKHRKSIIFRREYKQLAAIEDRSREILDHLGRYTAGDKMRWRFEYDGHIRQLEFGAVERAEDVKKWKGRPHDFIGYDEGSEFLESQIRYLLTWLRTTIYGQRCRVIIGSNPPESSDGRWLVDFFAPWLDERHPRPAKVGELRWFITDDQGRDVEVADQKSVFIAGRWIRPLSRTFIQARVTDNRYYAGGQYESVLAALREPLRSQMLNGDFKAGQTDDAHQVIPTSWVEAAQARWKPLDEKARGRMDALGVDVARGGRDRTVLTPRYGGWFAEPQVHPGITTPDGQAVVRLIIEAIGNQSPDVQIDVLGVGSSPTDIAGMNNIKVIAMNGAAASMATDRSGRLRFVNKRAEWHWKLREALDPENKPELALAIPPDREIKNDLCAPKWKLTARGIQIEDKDEVKKRLKRSPDKGESLLYAHAESDNPVKIVVPFIHSVPRELPT